MRRRLRPRTFPSPLDEMERNWSEEELDEEFGLLPGEEREEENDWWTQWEVDEWLVGEGRCLEAWENGQYAEGVWRKLEEKGDDTNSMRRWMMAVERVRKGVVMDGKCVEIVRWVWIGKEGRH